MRLVVLCFALLVATGGVALACNTLETLESRLIRHEGMRSCVYYDQFGSPTIGVGHLLKPPVKNICWDREKVLSVLRNDIARARANARHDVGSAAVWEHRLSPTRRNVLTELAFQLGGSGLARFHGMLDAVALGDYDFAAKMLVRSKLGRQTPRRANELACLMERG